MSSSTEELDVLLRKLATTERIIHGLLRTKHQGSAVLKEKLVQFEDLIAHLSNGTCVYGWHCKVVRWWQQYADATDFLYRERQELLVVGKHEEQSLQKPISYSEDQMMKRRVEPKWASNTAHNINKIDCRQLDATSNFGRANNNGPDSVTQSGTFCRRSSLPSFSPISVTNSKFTILPDGDNNGLRNGISKSHMSPSQSGSFSFEDGTPVDENGHAHHPLKHSQSKEDIRIEMEQSFALLEVVQSNQDIDSLKKLLLMMAKARASIKPYRFDRQLQLSMFDYAFAKLSHDKQELFRQNHSHGYQFRSFSELNRFLLSQVNNYYADLKMIGHELHKRVAKNASDQSSEFCDYCKTIGHVVVGCPSIKQMVCFRCFQSGHKAKYCHDLESQFYERKSQQQQQSPQPTKQCLDKNKNECLFDTDLSPNGSMDNKNGFICYVCNLPGHKAKFCSRRIEKCFKCDQLGHAANKCENNV